MKFNLQSEPIRNIIQFYAYLLFYIGFVLHSSQANLMITLLLSCSLLQNSKREIRMF